MLYESGKIEDVNYQIYCKWFDAFVKDFPICGVIYVETDPKICHSRIAKRSRLGESNIPLDYLKSCDCYHTHMLNRDFQKVSNRQLVLDGNTDIYENQYVLDDWIENIKLFVGC
jgi:deoxyadenosine/deoxycytidine kinase